MRPLTAILSAVSCPNFIQWNQVFLRGKYQTNCEGTQFQNHFSISANLLRNHMKEIKNNLTFLSEGTNKTSTVPQASRQLRFESFWPCSSLRSEAWNLMSTFYWVETAVQLQLPKTPSNFINSLIWMCSFL